jgi:hypothetical protein
MSSMAQLQPPDLEAYGPGEPGAWTEALERAFAHPAQTGLAPLSRG